MRGHGVYESGFPCRLHSPNTLEEGAPRSICISHVRYGVVDGEDVLFWSVNSVEGQGIVHRGPRGSQCLRLQGGGMRFKIFLSSLWDLCIVFTVTVYQRLEA